jgi:diguanylate cyclase (GGDEF)-like protein/PAS domain S-box-containing protein
MQNLWSVFDPHAPSGEHPEPPTAAEVDAVIAATSDLVFVFGHDGRFLKISANGRHTLPRSPAEILGRRVDQVLSGDAATLFLDGIRRAIETGETQRVDYQLEVFGEEKRFTATAVKTDDRTVVWVARDVSEQWAAEAALHASEAGHRELLAALPIIIYWVSPEPPFAPTYISPGIEVLGYTLEEWLSRPDAWVRSLHPDDRDRVIAETEAALASGTATGFEYRVVAKDGRVRWMHDRGDFVRDSSGRALAWRGVMIDVTERHALEEQLAARSERDELTGLLNRRGFRRMAEQSLKVEQRSGRRSALLFIDLDYFKPINDAHGHAAGDLALQSVAETLRAGVRDGDIVARFGGDEFVVLALGIGEWGEGQRLADRLSHGFARMSTGPGDDDAFMVKWSTGVAEVEGSVDIDELLARADTALYERKAARRPVTKAQASVHRRV